MVFQPLGGQTSQLAASALKISVKFDNLIFMKEETISVTEASRNFAECVNRAHYQDVTFILLKNGEPMARIIPDGAKRCTGAELAKALAGVELSEEEARAWHKDLQSARKSLKPAQDKWR